MFCILLLNSVDYVLLLLCVCILIVTYTLFCIFSFHRANWRSPATLTEVFPCFFLRQMPGCTSQRRDTVRTLTNYWIVLFYVLFCVDNVLLYVMFVLFYVLFVSKCVLLPPGVNPIAVNKYIMSWINIISLRLWISLLFMIKKTIQHSSKIASNSSVPSAFEPEIHFVI